MFYGGIDVGSVLSAGDCAAKAHAVIRTSVPAANCLVITSRSGERKAQKRTERWVDACSSEGMGRSTESDLLPAVRHFEWRDAGALHEGTRLRETVHLWS